jgi:hypothetical protein
MILAAYQRSDRKPLEAARLLGIGKTTLYRKLRKIDQAACVWSWSRWSTCPKMKVQLRRPLDRMLALPSCSHRRLRPSVFRGDDLRLSHPLSSDTD